MFQVFSQYANHISVGYDFQFSWLFVSLKHLVNNLLWLGLLPVVFTASQLVSQFKKAKVEYWIGYLLLSGIIALVQKIFSVRLYDLIYSFEVGYLKAFFGENNMTQITTGFFSGLLEVWILTAILLAAQYQRSLANKERDLARAKLDALRMQLHPHFLFNTLHSIASMIDIDVKKAQKMIVQVGDLLRKMLEHKESELVSVEQELKFIRNYLELEQIRFQDRMNLAFDVQKITLDAKIPHMILQPLVENYIKHGISNSTGDSRVIVSFKQYQNGADHQWLKMEVDNIDQDRSETGSSTNFGIGLKNVQNRLQEIYGNDFKCNFERIDTNHFKSSIQIPFEI